MGVQEIKAQADTVQGTFDQVAGMAGHFHYAQKKGYSGVGLYTRHEPSEVVIGIGNPEFDDEGATWNAATTNPAASSASSAPTSPAARRVKTANRPSSVSSTRSGRT